MKKYLLVILLAFLSISCTNDTIVEEDVLYEYTQRTIDSFNIDSSVKIINVGNHLGIVNISGNSDSVGVDYILDKTIKVKNSSLSQSAFEQIYLDTTIQDDTVNCIINSWPNNVFSKCNLNLIVPYNKPISVKNTNGEAYISNLDSDLFTEMDIYDCTIYHHNGSFEARSTSGKISGSISIPQNGSCICNSESGDIHLQIPTNSSVKIHLKTVSGSVSYSNLNIDISYNSETELKGAMNGGEGNIYLESKSGKIVLEGI